MCAFTAGNLICFNSEDTGSVTRFQRAINLGLKARVPEEKTLKGKNRWLGLFSGHQKRYMITVDNLSSLLIVNSDSEHTGSEKT